MRFLRPSLLHPPRPTRASPNHLRSSLLTSSSIPHHATSTFSTATYPLLNSNDSNKKSALLDREAVNTEPGEYSKSGSDSSAAEQSDPAFQAGKTDPDSELASSKPGKNGKDPLEVSPANHDVSQPRDEKEGGAERGVERTKGSGGSKGGSGGMKAKKVG